MEGTGCEVICGTPTTFAVEGEGVVGMVEYKVVAVVQVSRLTKFRIRCKRAFWDPHYLSFCICFKLSTFCHFQ